jgi:hypothetical protein
MLLAHHYLGTVAYPAGLPVVFEDFCWSYAEFRTFNGRYVERPGQRVHYTRSKISEHQHARNELVQTMRGDWLLQTDADHLVAPDLLLRMLDRSARYNAAVIVGIYFERSWPHAPVLYRRAEDFYGAIGEIPAEPFPIDSAGAGCLWVQKHVFDRIQTELGQLPFTKLPGLSEDHSFFRRCQQLEIPILCDPRIRHDHLAVRPITPADFTPSPSHLID